MEAVHLLIETSFFQLEKKIAISKTDASIEASLSKSLNISIMGSYFSFCNSNANKNLAKGNTLVSDITGSNKVRCITQLHAYS